MKMKFILLSFLFLFFSCEENIDRPFAQLDTVSVENISSGIVSITAEVISKPENDLIVDHGFIIRATTLNNLPTQIEAGSLKISLGATLDSNSFTAQVDSGISPGRTYYAKSYLKSDVWTVYGTEISFTLSN